MAFVFSKTNKRGSFLFETFVALLILSVGITATLRVFSEALLVGARNAQSKVAKEDLDHLLFEWFAYPGVVALPECGEITIPLDSKDPASELLCRLSFENLGLSEKDSEVQRQIQATKANQYYHVKLSILKKRQADFFDLDSVIYQTKKITSQ